MLSRRVFGLAAFAAAALAERTARAETVSPLSAEDQFMQEGRYLPRYLELKGQAAAGDESARQELAQIAALVGDETTAIGSLEEPHRGPAPDLAVAIAVDALDAIAARAKDTRVVILNEAHNISAHRSFAAQVLRRLRPLGFDIFAAEAFIQPQPVPAPTIKSFGPGQSLLPTLGYYVRDPVYAEAMREAVDLGYRLADYEARWDQYPQTTADAEEQYAAREIAQADNLIEILAASPPNARVFVYCGYSHVMESPGAGGAWFAARFKARSGIDPLTIEQSMTSPATRPDRDAPHVAAVLQRFTPTAPIAVSVAGAPVTTRMYEGRVDLSVFHPRYDPVRGRPGWLARDERRRPVTVRLPSFAGPALLQALHVIEGAGAVPADQVLLADGQAEATLFLPASAYLLRLEEVGGIQPAFGLLDLMEPSAV